MRQRPAGLSLRGRFLFPLLACFSYLSSRFHLPKDTMSGSFIFFFHLLGFGLLAATVFAGWFLNSRFAGSEDSNDKIVIGKLMRSLGFMLPVAALVLLVTGIGNIFNLYFGTPRLWYQQTWLVIKIILFGVMLVNGTLFGPSLGKKRMQLIHTIAEESATEQDQQKLRYLNRQMTWFFVVQVVLLAGIVFFSAFGPLKHPGYF